MKNIERKSKTAQTNEKLVKNTAKKKRGRPSKNGSLNDVFALEFKKFSLGQKLSISEKKFVKTIAETMLVQGFTVSEIAESLSIPKSTVCLWKDKLDDESKAKIEQNVLNSVSSNVSQFLNSSLVSMSKMALRCSSKEYLQDQPIEDVAKFFDTLGDFTFNLIETKERFELKKSAMNNPAQDKYD
jgi:hypothetical protein